MNIALLVTQVIRLHNANEDAWEIPRSEIEVGGKLGQGNYGAVFKAQLTVTAMSPRVHTHKKEMDFEGKSHLTVVVKMLRRKCSEIIPNTVEAHSCVDNSEIHL